MFWEEGREVTKKNNSGFDVILIFYVFSYQGPTDLEYVEMLKCCSNRYQCIESRCIQIQLKRIFQR